MLHKKLNTNTSGTNILVFLNGLLLTPPGDFGVKHSSTITSPTLTFKVKVGANSLVNILSHNGFRAIYKFDGKKFDLTQTYPQTKAKTTTKAGAFQTLQIPLINLPPLPWVVDKESETAEPQNNDGRKTCFWCNKKTKNVQGFSSSYDICESCGK